MKPEKAIVILRMGEQARWRSGVTVEEEKEALDMAIESLKGRPHGEWIIHRNKQGAHIYSVCSICNVPHLDTDFPNFCENCGSDNRKKEDKPHGS